VLVVGLVIFLQFVFAEKMKILTNFIFKRLLTQLDSYPSFLTWLINKANKKIRYYHKDSPDLLKNSSSSLSSKQNREKVKSGKVTKITLPSSMLERKTRNS